MNQPIRRYAKQLAPADYAGPPAGIWIRQYRGFVDQDRWISLHQQAFEVSAAWSRRHFMREFCQKQWWDSARMWFACDAADNALGTACLGEKLMADGAPAGTVLWLAVDPNHQRCGIGRALVEHLQREALQRGYHRLELETLSQWQAANRLYEDLGFIRM